MTQLNKRVGQVFTPIKKGGANFLNLTPPNLSFFYYLSSIERSSAATSAPALSAVTAQAASIAIFS